MTGNRRSDPSQELEEMGLKWTLRPLAKKQRGLGAEATWVPELRRILLPTLNPYAKRFSRPLLREKATTDYVVSTGVSPSQVAKVVDETYHRNLLSTKKYRYIDGEKQWERGSWRVVDPDDIEWQHHLFYFQSAVVNGGTDLYHHKEYNYVIDPKAHESRGQTPGDPGGILRDTLAEAGVDYRKSSELSSELNP